MEFGAEGQSLARLTRAVDGTGAAPDAIIVNISSAEYHARQLMRIIAGENWDK